MTRARRTHRVPGSEAVPEPAPDWATRSHQVLLCATIGLLVATPLIPSESAYYLGSHVVLVFGWFLLAAAWLIRAVLLPPGNGRVDASEWAVALLVVVHSVSALVMLRAGHPRPTLNAMWQWVSYGVLFVLCRRLLDRPVAQRALTSILIALGVGMASLGFFQVLHSNPQLRAQYARDPEGTLRKADIHAPPGSPQRRHFEDRLGSTEPTGPFALTNSLAGFLAPLTVLMAYVVMACSDRVHWRRAVLGAIPLLMLAGCLLLTKSRSAYLATLFGLALLGLRAPMARSLLRNGWVVATAVVAMAAAMMLGIRFGGLDRQVLTEAPKSLLYRGEYWQSTLALIGDHPVWGCGPGNFKDFYTRYKLPQASETVADPHNFLLEVSANSGLPAAALLVLALATALRYAPGGAGGRATDSPDAASQSADRVREAPSEPTEPELPAAYTGLALGIVLAFPAGWAGGLAADEAMLWTTLPASLLTIWILHPWVRSGVLPSWPVFVAVMTLLIHLLVAGALGFPGIGQLVWVLAAVALSVSTGERGRTDDATPATGTASRRPAASGRGGKQLLGALLALQVLLLAASYLTMYRPVLSLRGILSAPDSRADQPLPESVLEAAITADPWSAEPRELRVSHAAQRWTHEPTPQRLADYDQAVTQLLAVHPQASSIRRYCGDLSLEMYAFARDPALLARALRFYREAVERYPQSNILRAQLAWTYFLAGELTAARDEAERALQLDRMLPHTELQLVNQVVVGNDLTPDAADLPAAANAEQTMQHIRKVPSSK